MSRAKRVATTDLNHDNWDQEDDEPEQPGTFKMADPEVLQKRIIKTAKRKLQSDSNDGPKSAFSNLSGFSFGVETKGKNAFSFLSNISKNAEESKEGKITSNNEKTDPGEKVKNTFAFLNSFSENKTTDGVLSNDLKSKEKNELSENQNKLCANTTKRVKFCEPQTPQNDTQKELSPQDIYLYSLKCLNYCFVEWILKHVNENATYILTPIFRDYEKYLKELKNEKTERELKNKPDNSESLVQNADKGVLNISNQDSGTRNVTNLKPAKIETKIPEIAFASHVTTDAGDKRSFNFSASPKNVGIPSTSFGTTSRVFNFTAETKTGDNDKKDNVNTSNTLTFSDAVAKFNATKSDTSNAAIGSGYFGFKSQLEKSEDVKINNEHQSETKNENENDADEDNEHKQNEPVKEIKEDGSVYNKRCKVFFKINGVFKDRGIGILFLKLVGNDKKCQLIIRTDNGLANIMLNILLTSAIPVQKVGKNNVLILCCPTKDDAPTPVLLKVKTPEDADELLESLKKYR